MPKLVSMGRNREEKDSLYLAKGKNGMSFANEFFASTDDMLYAFGLIPEPKKKKN
ncbi:MAG: hypothetical protein PHC92_11925 [Syntrophomonadaceae bacterium]|nr:hypothetical protein [Syntrophomonadaceae bacterium]MDD3024905.1 hypothetical protein [Syntrophomonadaceae bacterium]